MISTELRQKFLDFFKEKGHTVIPSASLVPENDPSVLFTTAGMQQFKPYYTKPAYAPSARITSAQLCVRTSDIDEVGDNTHLTLFEMLGNFSFGYPSMENSYFKEEAIKFAWEFLTNTLKIETDRISCTYFKGEKEIPPDDVGREILEKTTGFSSHKIKGMDKSETFWGPTGDEGPCGPTVEFYVDDIEIWNLVFNQYYFKDGRYTPLEYQGIDTGMGLERLLVILNGINSVYETDLFLPLIQEIEEISNKDYKDFGIDFRIIADHIKAAIFIISDGIMPSKTERGFVLRRLIRKSIDLIEKNLKCTKPQIFVIRLADAISTIYETSYNQIAKKKNEIIDVLNNETTNYLHERYKLVPRINKRIAVMQRALRKQLDLSENADKKILKSAFVDPSDTISVMAGKFAYSLWNTNRYPKEEFCSRISKEFAISGKEFEKGYEEGRLKFEELSRTASAGMFKGGLADAGEIATKYHTATHLLNAALRQVLSGHVYQKGSNITAERLRFDFSYPEKMTPEQIKEVEGMVNEQIKKDLPVSMTEMTIEEAKAAGALGVFESKYGEKVKVYTIGPTNVHLVGGRGETFSKEICGGPHVARTGELGRFKIVKEEASSAGVRRIKAVLE